MVTILGPTASGKTALAARLACESDGEIISADSRQVYRRMDLGTGKDLADYEVDGRQVKYHLIDICEPGTKYNLFQYQQDFHEAYGNIVGNGHLPILCGGTGLYIEAVLKGYALSPVPQNEALRQRLEGKSLEELTDILTELKRKTGGTMHNRTDVDTAQRAIRAIEIEEHNLSHPMPEPHPGLSTLPSPLSSKMGGEACGGVDSLIVGVAIDREERRRRISERLQQRIDDGMVEEVRGLIDEGIPPENLIYYGLEYKYITEYVIGQTTYDEMFGRLEIAIHQFAKRQMTWFRGMERRGFHINWIDGLLPMDEKIKMIKQLWQ